MASHVCSVSWASTCFKCFGARGFTLGRSDRVSLDSKHGERVVRGLLGDAVMETENGMNGRAVVSLSVGATHLSMASENSDVVGTKAVPQTPQRAQGLACVFHEHSTKYSSSAAHTLKLYHHIPGLRCPLDIWQQTWERHERIQRGNATERNTLITSYNNRIHIHTILSSYCSDLAQWFSSSDASLEQQSVDCECITPTQWATQQSVDCESITPTQGATQQSVGYHP